MLHATFVVLLIGLGDSLNPSTVGPAAYLASADRPRRQLTLFLAGWLAVNLLAGIVITLGPGELLLGLVPKPKPVTKNILEVVAGVTLIVAAVLIWWRRRGLGTRKIPSFTGGRRSGAALGAGIAAVELPTAMPYLAAIAVIVGSGVAVPGKVALLLVYNLAAIAPVLAILILVLALGDAATKPLARAKHWVLGHWPGVIAGAAALIGLSVLALGVIGLAGG